MSQSDLTVQDGKPTELYLFTQAAESWYFTDALNSMFHNVAEYFPANISRSDIEQTEDMFKASLNINFPRDNEFALSFLEHPSEAPTVVTIFRGQSDLVSPGPFETYWKGRVIAGKANDSVIELECESIFTAMRRPGLRARYEKMCRHALYDHMCKVNREAWAVSAQVQTLADGDTSLQLTGISGYADGYFTAGLVKVGDADFRFISRHTTDVVVITKPFTGLVPTTPVIVYPGCDHLTDTCLAKFSNLDNYGGFPYLPYINPFRLGGLF